MGREQKTTCIFVYIVVFSFFQGEATWDRRDAPIDTKPGTTERIVALVEVGAGTAALQKVRA
jgi:hypothetical protein